MWVGSIIVLVVIVVMFVGAPVAGKIGSGSSRMVFGSYDGDDLEFYEGSFFADQVYSIAENYRDSMNDQNSQFIQFQVWRSAFDNAIQRLAVIKEMKNSGVVISGKAIDKAIVNYGPYMENGEFSENLYSQSSNIEKKATRKRFEEDLYFSQFMNDINSVVFSEKENEFFSEMAATEKNYKFVYFPFSAYPDMEVEKYADDNSTLFRKISLSKITVNTDIKDAEQILSKLEIEPGIFSELAKTQSSDPYADKGGEMGSSYYYELKNLIDSEEDLNAIFSLKEGEISGIIENNETWAIYRCDKAAEDAGLSASEELSVVRKYMERYEKGIIEDYLVAQAESFTGSARTDSFENAGVNADKDIYETGYFPIVYGNPSFYYYQQNIPIFKQISSTAPDNVLSGVSNNEYFLKSINKLEKNEISEPLILNDNILVLQLTDVKDTDPAVNESLGGMVSYAGQTWRTEQLREIVFSSDKLEDNFTSAFSKIFLSN